jgi:hypothetical protein
MVESMEETEGTMAQMEGIEGFMYMIDDDALAFLDLSEEDIADILHEARDSVNKLSDEMEIISG